MIQHDVRNTNLQTMQAMNADDSANSDRGKFAARRFDEKSVRAAFEDYEEGVFEDLDGDNGFSPWETLPEMAIIIANEYMI